MPDGRDVWAEQVRAAAVARDEVRLRALFALGKPLWGAELSHEWARVLSDLDGTAVTG